jgi:integrase/recombinase XerD
MELNLRGYSPQTIKNYRNTLDNLMKYSEKSLKNMREDDIKGYLFYLQREKDNSLKSIHRHLNAIKTFYKINNLNTADNIKLPKINKEVPVFLNFGEIKRLILATDNLRDKLIIQLLYASGLRVSELVALNRDSIEDNKIKVQHGKGGKDRITYIDPSTRELLDTYLNSRNDQEKALFINKFNKRITTRSIERIVKKYAKEANINKKISPHTLRHSFATHLLQNKANIVVIKDLLGHSNLSTTQIYTTLADEYKEEIYKNSYPLKNIGL